MVRITVQVSSGSAAFQGDGAGRDHRASAGDRAPAQPRSRVPGIFPIDPESYFTELDPRGQDGRRGCVDRPRPAAKTRPGTSLC